MHDEGFQRDVTSLAGVLGRPVTVDELASVIGIEPDRVLRIAISAEAVGLLRAEGGGYLADPADVTPRLALLAGRFADLLTSRGAPDEEIATLLRLAQRDAEAVPHLLASIQRGSTEALGSVLEMHDSLGVLDPETEGDLRIRHAAHLADVGENHAAFDEAVRASHRLSGGRRVDALGFAAAIADNLQHPQQSEVMAALAAGAAYDEGDPAKEGSLLTLQARGLNRVGYAIEADGAFAKGWHLLEEHGTSAQRRTGRRNEAAILFDRGEVRRAAWVLDLVLAAPEDDDPVSRLVGEASLARALFATGASGRALPLAQGAIDHGTELGSSPAVMLGHMGIAEGALAVGRTSDALEQVEIALTDASDELPQWVNRLHLLRAECLLVAGRNPEALEATTAGLLTTPRGVDGLRVRVQLEAIAAVAAGAPASELAEHTDALLHAQWFGAALRLMVERARREEDRLLGLEAAGLAHRLGMPLMAASAIEAVHAWDAPEAVPIAQSIKDLEGEVADDWAREWRTRTDIARALGVDTSAPTDDAALDERIDDALRSAGLSGVDVVLSPAQRAAKGLSYRSHGRRQRWSLAWVALVAVAAVVAYLVWPPPPPPPPPPPCSADIAGSFATSGSSSRTGEGSGGVAGDPCGFAWDPVELGGTLGSPTAYGIRAFVSSSSADAVYSIELATGRVVEEIEADDRVLAPPAIGQVSNTAGFAQTLLVAVSQAGTVYAKDLASRGVVWSHALGSEVEAAPLIADDLVIVGTRDGRMVAFNGGSVSWEYPSSSDRSLGQITAAPAFADGLIYFTAGRELVALDTGGAEVCRGAVSTEEAIGSPMLSDGDVYVLAAEGFIRVDVGDCGPGTGDPRVPTSQPLAMADGLAVSVEGRYLFAFPPGTVGAGDPTDTDEPIGAWTFEASSEIQGQPSIADGIVYVGTQAGMVHAIDLESGSELWFHDVGAPVRGSVSPVSGAVLASLSDGRVVAISGFVSAP